MKTFSFQLLLIIAFSFFAISVHAQKIHKEYFDNGKLKQEGQYNANGEGVGYWKFYYESGKLQKTGNYLDGKPNGEWKYYDEESGWVFDILDYKNGKKIDPTKGCYSGDCQNGYGKYFKNYLEKTKLIGPFKNGELNGKGYQLTLKGIVVFSYEGDFVNGKKEGQGQWVDNAGSTYIGAWKSDKREGQGIENEITFFGNTTYEGIWKADKKEGFGTEITYVKETETEKYVGNWKADKRHGEGKLYKDGQLVYEGNFHKNIAKKISGCIVGNCKNGFGVFISADKNQYIGEFKNGEKSGKGLENDPKGNYIIGHWQSHKEEGHVKVFNPNNELMFSGEMKAGKPLKVPSRHEIDWGCVYGDCENGFGHFKWENGDIYVGEFKNNAPHGEGTSTFASGDKYIGQYENGAINGYGRAYDKTGKVAQEGKWINNTCHVNFKISLKKGECTSGDCVNGYGVQTIAKENWGDDIMLSDYDFVERYEGLWKDGKKSGYGFLEIAKKGIYVGDLLNGEYHGQGTIVLTDGTTYYGGFKEGRRQGQGSITFPNGSKYEGAWEAGEKSGIGKEYDPSGQLIYSGKFKRDQRIE